ncbi:MurR/RpiR family transcriptional regulator [uncultured Jannaschia sp.]|uniref:MurR/RpiR family transcriptional regulator n=1 Tax=uncultured Jannaschia sp. TaxID=293347 RepID=UPI00260DD869|nr:MurR/RpiR family transcriptional regulator [uncultured Jannaschia sp.]
MNNVFQTDIAQRVSRAYEKLSPGHRRIADFILENPTEAAPLNNIELATRCEVSTATATRFARAIGFPCFSDFRESQLEAMRAARFHVERLSREIDAEATHFDVVRNGLDQDIRNLQTTRDRLDEASCGRAVEMILNAERIFAFGAGLSQYAIGVLIHGLEPYCRGNAINIGPMGNGNVAIRRAVHCTDRDLVITCSLPNYAADTIEVTQTARRKGATILCITDRPTSPLTKYADAVFYADATRRLLPNSITSAIAVSEGIIAAIANRRQEGLDG